MATYYIKPTGLDSKDGLSVANAWGTLVGAATAIGDGDILIFSSGVYKWDYVASSNRWFSPIGMVTAGDTCTYTATGNIEFPTPTVGNGSFNTDDFIGWVTGGQDSSTAASVVAGVSYLTVTPVHYGINHYVEIYQYVDFTDMDYLDFDWAKTQGTPADYTEGLYVYIGATAVWNHNDSDGASSTLPLDVSTYTGTHLLKFTVYVHPANGETIEYTVDNIEVY